MSPKEIPHLFQSNEQLSKEYTYVQTLGKGGMGEVYLAKDNNLNRLVAIKTLLAVKLSDKAELERLKREALALSRLNHPNLIRVFAVTQWEGLVYLVTEYVQGKNLRELVRSGTLNRQRTLNIIVDTAATLEYVHNQGMIHRDIKPANILVEKGDKPRIIDFGLAKQYDKSTMYTNITREGECIGTPRYMAPEALRGKPLSPPCDQYSLGVVLFELMSGQAPVDGDPVTIARAHFEDTVPLFSEVAGPCDPQIDTFFATVLATEPENRFPSMLHMSDALARIAPLLLTFKSSPPIKKGSSRRDGRTKAREVNPQGKTRIVKASRDLPTRKQSKFPSSMKSHGNHSPIHTTDMTTAFPSGNKRKLAVACVMFVILAGALTGAYVFSTPGTSHAIKRPQELSFSRRKRGSIELSWEKSPVRVTSIKVIEETSGKEIIFRAADGRARLNGLTPGQRYKYSLVFENGDSTPLRNLVSPEDELVVSKIEGPPTFDSPACVQLETLEEVKLLCTYSQEGTSITTSLSSDFGKKHYFRYYPSRGCFSDLKITSLNKNDVESSIDIPSYSLRPFFTNSVAALNTKCIVTQCSIGLREYCVGNKTEDDRGRKLGKLIYDAAPGFPEFLAIYPFSGYILDDNHEDVIPLKESVLKAIDFSLLANAYRANWKIHIDNILSGTFEGSIDVGTDNPRGTYGKTVVTICNYADAKEDEKNIPMIFPDDLENNAANTLRVEMASFNRPHHHYVNRVESDFTVDSKALKSSRSAKVRIASHVFRPDFKLMVELNGNCPIPFISRTPYIGHDKYQNSEDKHSGVISRVRRIPMSYLKEGPNKAVFTVSSPFGTSSALIPTLRTAFVILER